jgi:type VI secretion system secreted protein Hcp
MKRIVFLLFAAALAAPSLAQAQFVSCKITGQQQGLIKTDNPTKGQEDTIPVLSLSSSVISPRDAATGQASGKRQHQPISLIKTLDRASPLLFLAAVTNETLTEVLCKFYRTEGAGKELVYFTIRLEDAHIAEDSIAGSGQVNQGMRETVRFVFRKITLTYNSSSGSVEASDDWEIQNQ